MQQNVSILVVDDELFFQRTIKDMLDNQGYQISFAANGAEALLMAEKLSPAVILLDVVLPDIDGYEICRRIRSNPRLSLTSIIIITVLHDPDARMSGYQAGCDDFLSKPITAVELWTRVRTHIRLWHYRRLSQEKSRFHREITDLPRDVNIIERAVHMSDGVMLLAGDGTIRHLNMAMIHQFSRTTDHELRGEKFQAFIMPEDRGTFQHNLKEFRKDPEQICLFELKLRQFDHKPFYVEVAFLPSKNIMEKGIQCIIRDITELKHIQEALETSEEKYHRIFYNIRDVYFETSIEGTIIEISPSVQSMFGYCREELVGTMFFDLILKDPGRRGLLKSILKEESFPNYEMIMMHKDGQAIVCSLNVKLEKDSRDKPRKIIGLIRNITERKQVEERLQLMEKAFETTHTGITITDISGKILYVNPAEAEMHGFTQTELIEEDIGILAPTHLRKPMTSRQIKKIKNRSRESINVRRDGSSFPVFLRSDAVFKQNGEPLGIVTTSENISERKEVEKELQSYRDHLEELVEKRTEELTLLNKQLQNEIAERKKLQDDLKHHTEHLEELVEQRTMQMIQTQKLASLGVFSRGSAHEQRQYQQAVLTAAQRIKFAMLKTKDQLAFAEIKPFILDRIQSIEGSVRASNSLVNSLLEYSRGKLEEFELIKVSEQVNHTLTIVGHSIKQDSISLIQDVAETPLIYGSAMQIKEMIMNLITNAWHAVRESTHADKEIVCRVQVDQRYIYLIVQDNGIGIAKKDRNKIFDVYYTTKAPHEGTGLGLSIVSRYVQNHEGFITFESEPGKGSLFTLALPRYKKEDRRDRKSKNSARRRRQAGS